MFFLRPKVSFIIAIIVGAVATIGVYAYLENEKNELQKPKVQVRNIVVAATNLMPGTRLDRTNIKISQWPEDLVPDGTFNNIDTLDQRIVNTPIVKNEPVLVNKMAAMGSSAGFSSLIPPGKRAMTVSVDMFSGVSGFILPNTRVDVLMTVSTISRREDSTTRIILEDVRVLAVDQTTQTNENDPITVKSVTLLVTPQQAEKLALASTEGRLVLTLRNTSDRAQQATSGVRLKELVKEKKTCKSRPIVVKEKEPEPENNVRVVEWIRSSEKTVEVFEEE